MGKAIERETGYVLKIAAVSFLLIIVRCKPSRDKNGSIELMEEIKKAAEQEAEAQFDLALCYANGQGVVQDHSQTLYWIKQVASQGNKNAIVSLNLLEK